MRRVRLRTLIVVVAFLALVLALGVQARRSAARERRLQLLLEATRAQLQEERDQTLKMLEKVEIRVAPEPDVVPSTSDQAPR